jgi:xylulokinase
MPGSPSGNLFLGLDIGTSGARAVVIDRVGAVRSAGKSAMADHGADHRDPGVWLAAAESSLDAALEGVDRGAVRALAVDGTSGTMLAVDAVGRPLGPGIMYNDACGEAAVLAAIESHAPADSAAHGPTSGAARAVVLSRLSPYRVLHQADWIVHRLAGRMVSDANNALKSGYDPVAGKWPDWLERAGVDRSLLPDVMEPGVPIGPVTSQAAARFGLDPGALVVAGTTDGCASFLATGADRPGDGVTALGTTLTLKLLSDRPIFAPGYGIYSHRLLGMWLPGGASNSGGAALLAHFTADEMAELSPRMDASSETGLSYYPLPGTGERFPIADPAMLSRTEPRPADRVRFLQALFEGLADVEALGYRRLAELGAPPLRSVRSVGGAAGNFSLTRIRERRLGVPMPAPLSGDAAYGTALLARRGVSGGGGTA